jgi:hypothetical protein
MQLICLKNAIFCWLVLPKSKTMVSRARGRPYSCSHVPMWQGKLCTEQNALSRWTPYTVSRCYICGIEFLHLYDVTHCREILHHLGTATFPTCSATENSFIPDVHLPSSFVSHESRDACVQLILRKKLLDIHTTEQRSNIYYCTIRFSHLFISKRNILISHSWTKPLIFWFR